MFTPRSDLSPVLSADVGRQVTAGLTAVVKTRYIPLHAGTQELLNDYLDEAHHAADTEGALPHGSKGTTAGAQNGVVATTATMTSTAATAINTPPEPRRRTGGSGSRSGGGTSIAGDGSGGGASANTAASDGGCSTPADVRRSPRRFRSSGASLMPAGR